MSKQIEKDAKTPDQLQAGLQQGFTWTQTHVRLVMGLILAFVIIGGGWSVWSQIALKKETELQERYFVIEKKILEKKRGFDEAEQQDKMKEAAAKAGKPQDPKAAPATKASGDLAKDYGSLPQELEALVAEAPESRAGQMAALNLAELKARYKQPDEALRVLAQVNKKEQTSHLIGALVLTMKANLTAEKGDCPQALTMWEKIVKEPKAAFLHDETKLRMGLCYEAVSDWTKAEQLYTEVSKREGTENGDSSATKDAERYLRLLKLKKQTRGT